MTWSSVNSDSGNAKEFLADTWTVTIKTFVFVRQCNGIRNHWTWEVNFFFVGWMKKVEKLRLTPTYWISTDYLNYALMDVLSAPIVADFSSLFRASFIAFECCFYSNCMHLFGYNCLLHRSIRRTTKEQPKCYTIDRTKPKTIYANEK